MSIQELGALGEFVSSIVVLITLIYLAIQVRQGNLLARTQARERMVEHAHNELFSQINDPSITYAVVKEGPLTEDEQARLSLFLTQFMRQREWEWFQLNDGVIDEDVYVSYRDVMAIFLGTERTRKWWQTIGRFAFNPLFVKEVDSFLAVTEHNDYLIAIRRWDDA